MSLFDAKGVILIAVDEKFTLEDKDGREVGRGSIHRQFVDTYCGDNSEYGDYIRKKVNNKGESSEVVCEIGDKTFVLFAYSKLGVRDDYRDNLSYERSFYQIEGSLKKVLLFCKEQFPDKVINTALIGTGIESDPSRTQKPHKYSLNDARGRLNDLAKELNVQINIIEKN